MAWPSAVMATEEFSVARIIRVKAGSGLGLDGRAVGGMILVTSEGGSAAAGFSDAGAGFSDAGSGFSDERCARGDEGTDAGGLIEPVAVLPETLAGVAGPAAAMPELGAVEVLAAGCDAASS